MLFHERKYLDNAWETVADFFAAEKASSRFQPQLLELKPERRHASAVACALQTRWDHGIRELFRLGQPFGITKPFP